MPRDSYVDLSLALFLARACRETYSQFLHDGKFEAPPGYEPLRAFKASAGGDPEWFGYIARSEDAVLVVFRGTVTERDWVADAEFFQTDFPYGEGQSLRTHTGFTRLYSSCRDEVMQALLDQPDTLTLLISGHSLGSALATLCATDAERNTSFRDAIFYGFGGPRVGNPAFARAFNKQDILAVRVVNVHDVVPRLPPAYIEMPETSIGLRYQHVGREYAFSVQTGSVKGNHEIGTYILELERSVASPPQRLRALRLGTYERLTSRRRPART
ncbi:MAG: lipase family protein [Bacillota bacterium]